MDHVLAGLVLTCSRSTLLYARMSTSALESVSRGLKSRRGSYQHGLLGFSEQLSTSNVASVADALDFALAVGEPGQLMVSSGLSDIEYEKMSRRKRPERKWNGIRNATPLCIISFALHSHSRSATTNPVHTVSSTHCSSTSRPVCTKPLLSREYHDSCFNTPHADV